MSSYVFKIATQDPDQFLAAISETLGADSRIGKQIQEQMPKPKPAQPTGTFLVVVAGQWPPFRKVGEMPWTNEDGYQFDLWADFTDYFPRAEFVIYRPERDEAIVKAEALRDAANAQRTLANEARTRDGKAEHEDIADWLDDRAAAISPSLEGAHP